MSDEMNDKSKANMPHDKGYRDVFSNKDSFMHFLNKYIKASWAKDISPDDIEQVNATFIMQDYQKRESDVIYRLNNKNVYFYVLLELQSTPDFTMPFRLLQYMVNLLANEFKNTPVNIRESKDFRLPAIVPIVMYNGEDSWTPVRSFKEYTSNYGEFSNNIIDFEYLLFDLNRFNQEDILTTHRLLDFIFTIDSKHFTRTTADFINECKKLVELQHDLTDDEIVVFVSWFASVILKGKVPENFEKEAVTAFRKGDVEIMTYHWDRLLEKERMVYKQEGRQEGIREGIREGKLEDAIEMIKEGLSFDIIKRVTKLPDEEIISLIGSN